jgi:predicted 3-demethylubiquinone-9 3-methyltransferase (glyoxalase superfamily)
MSSVMKREGHEEIDYDFGKLPAVLEAEHCSWVKDKDGVSWQIVPKNLDELVGQGGAEGKRVFEVVLRMKKLDFAELKEAP